MDSGVVRALLEGQREDGYWGAPERFYKERGIKVGVFK